VARDRDHEREMAGKVRELLRKANVRIGSYSDDMGYEYDKMHIGFARA